MATWKTILGHDAYEVSIKGEVRTRGYTYTYDGEPAQFYQPAQLVPLHKTSGYFYARLDGEICKVHRLVAEAFIDNPENKNYVSHKDGNIENNAVENLFWSSPKPNINKVTPKGIKIKCVEDNLEFKSIKAASQYYNIDYDKLIYSAKRNKPIGGYTWELTE